MIFRIIEKKLLEPFLFIIKNFFSSEEKYFQTVMFLRYFNRKIFGVQLTSDHKFQKNKFKYFKKMKKGSKVMEIGCGNLGLGYHLIKYLNKDNYVGVDISKFAIKNSIKLIISNPNISKKNPKVHLVQNINEVNSFVKNYNSKIFIFSSVFTHLSRNKILSYLNMIKKLKGDICILADFSISKSGYSYNIKNIDYYYSMYDLKKILSIFDHSYKVKFYKMKYKNNLYQCYLAEIKKY